MREFMTEGIRGGMIRVGNVHYSLPATVVRRWWDRRIDWAANAFSNSGVWVRCGTSGVWVGVLHGATDLWRRVVTSRNRIRERPVLVQTLTGRSGHTLWGVQSTVGDLMLIGEGRMRSLLVLMDVGQRSRSAADRTVCWVVGRPIGFFVAVVDWYGEWRVSCTRSANFALSPFFHRDEESGAPGN